MWAVLLLLPGCLLIGATYTTALVALALAGCAVLAVVLTVLGSRLGVSRWATSLVVALLLVLLAHLVGAADGLSLRSTLADAVPRLLTSPLPLPVSGGLVAPSLLVVGVVALAVGIRLTAARRDAVTPVLGGALLYLAGALLSSGRGDRFGLLVGVLVATAVLGWAVLDRPTRPAGVLREIRPVAALALPVVVALTLVGALAPRQGAFEPRKLVAPPVRTVATSSPLPQLAAWNEHPAQELFRVRGPEYPLRLVTLTTYDGTDWRAVDRYRPLGGYEHATLPPGSDRVRMRAAVDLTDLSGPWLPVPGTPAAVSAPSALVDPDSGSTLVQGRPTTHYRYSVAGDVDSPSDRVLASATVPTGASTAVYLRVPHLPRDLRTYARVVTNGLTTPYGRAKAIERSVQGGRRLNPTAIGGSSYWRVRQFLLGEGGAGAQTGTSEQFATSFALLARASGLPTRIVVGFRPGTPTDDTGDGGTRSVRGRDAFAWPEVYFTGLGWVPFSPSPQAGGFTRPDTDQPPTKQQQKAPDRGSVTSPTGPTGRVAGPAARPAPSGPPVAVLVAGGVVAVLLLAVLLVLLARHGRRRRHRRGGPTGAWQHVLDSARLAGIRPDRSRPAADLAVVIDGRTGREARDTQGAVRVARTAERAAFGPDIVEDGAVWEVAVDTGRALRRGTPWWRRALWDLDPRAFRRR